MSGAELAVGNRLEASVFNPPTYRKNPQEQQEPDQYFDMHNDIHTIHFRAPQMEPLSSS